MARHTFLGDMSSWVIDTGAAETATDSLAGLHALAIPNVTVTFWSAVTGGTQYTDLLNAGGGAITQTASDASGHLAQISGPDSIMQMWADAAGGSGPRVLCVATDLGPSLANYLPLATGGVVSGPVSATTIGATGITGATLAMRFVGATSSGHPTTGTFDTGDICVDDTGILWICTAGGSPGTWVNGAVEVPWIIKPSGDTSGATDPVNVANAVTTYGFAQLAPGAYYANNTVTGHEGQYVRGPGKQAATWTLTATGKAAFNWTPATSTLYSKTGGGGVTGLTVVGVSATANPTDGSVGFQGGDIVNLEADIFAINCQYGVLLSNQFFWTEQAQIKLRSRNNTNPVVLQCAASGGTSRTGSFERTRIEVWHDESLGTPAFGNGGVQLLAGAFIDGGAVKQYGNWGGTGQSGAYALYVSGATPAGAASASNSGISGSELFHGLEYNGTGTKPSSIFIGSGCNIDAAGTLAYPFGWGTSPSISGAWAFAGPIRNDATLASKLWSIVNPSLSGWTGNISYKINGQGDVIIDFALTIATTTVVADGQTIATLPAGFYYPTDNKTLNLNINGGGLTGNNDCAIQVRSGGTIVFEGTGFTASGSAFLYGQATYSTLV